MILVDVYAPSVDYVYDFLLDENAPVQQVVIEIIGMISKKVKETVPDGSTDFKLYSIDTGMLLNGEQSLAVSGIADGSRLLLV